MSDGTGKFRQPDSGTLEKWQLPRVASNGSAVFRNEPEPNKRGREDQAADKPEVTPPSAKEIQALRKKAEEEGYRQGMQRADRELADQRQQVQEIIDFFEAPLQALNEDVEQELSLLAVTLAQQLVKREIRADPGELIGVIREAVKMLPSYSRKIKIVLNPDDADLVRSTLQLDEHDEDLKWKLIEDPIISRGGCEIRSDSSVINATLENRLHSLAASVLGGDRSEDLDDCAAD